MNTFDETILLSHCLQCDTALDETESMYCTECSTMQVCQCCKEAKPDVEHGLCDECDSKYGE